MLNKCTTWFTCEPTNVFLGHCAISPLFSGSAAAIREFTENMAAGGVTGLMKHLDVMPKFHESFAKLMKTEAQNISYVQNTATAMSMLAWGYPFEPGDQVVSYLYEYPSNHYPWALQQQRGVELVLLGDVGAGAPLGLRGWSMDELEQCVTAKTRVVAMSHVQFASGFAADLEDLGAFCKARNIDLIVDCAQSLGCLPVYPETYNIAALASSGWKWLMGPFGAGVMYTSEEFREKVQPVLTGPGMMQQGLEYLDHTWAPHQDGRFFEFSATPWDHVAALQTVVAELFLQNSMVDIRDEIFRLQDLFLQHIDPSRVKPIRFDDQHRSGIMGLEVKSDASKIMAAMQELGVVITGPTGMLRLAPHFYMEDAQMVRAAELMNSVL